MRPPASASAVIGGPSSVADVGALAARDVAGPDAAVAQARRRASRPPARRRRGSTSARLVEADLHRLLAHRPVGAGERPDHHAGRAGGRQHAPAVEEGQAAHLGRIAAHAHVLGVGEPPAVQGVLLHRRHQEAAVRAEEPRRCASPPSAASPAAARRSGRTRAPRRRRWPTARRRPRASQRHVGHGALVGERPGEGRRRRRRCTRASRPAPKATRLTPGAAPRRSRSSGPWPRPAARVASRRDQTSAPVVAAGDHARRRSGGGPRPAPRPSCGACARAALPAHLAVAEREHGLAVGVEQGGGHVGVEVHGRRTKLIAAA